MPEEKHKRARTLKNSPPPCKLLHSAYDLNAALEKKFDSIEVVRLSWEVVWQTQKLSLVKNIN